MPDQGPQVPVGEVPNSQGEIENQGSDWATQLATARGPVYWTFMLVAMLIYLSTKNGCFDGTYQAQAACRGVDQLERQFCVQCVKAGGTWSGGVGFLETGGCSMPQ